MPCCWCTCILGDASGVSLVGVASHLDVSILDSHRGESPIEEKRRPYSSVGLASEPPRVVQGWL